MADQEAAGYRSGEVWLLITLHTRVHCNGGLAAYGVEEMSEQIDWSKAPEWAKWHGLAGEMKSQVWFDDEKYSYVDGQQDGKAFFYCDACTYSSQDFSNVTFRPSTPSWSGEGLPPVGVVCEVNPDKAGWRKSVISYIGDGFVAWLQVGDLIVPEYGAFIDDCEFRKIRTPEQIAASERGEAIKCACADIDKLVAAYNMSIDCSAAIRATIEAMIDKGYRKP